MNIQSIVGSSLERIFHLYMNKYNLEWKKMPEFENELNPQIIKKLLADAKAFFAISNEHIFENEDNLQIVRLQDSNENSIYYLTGVPEHLEMLFMD
jgi:hypothetical protein